MVFAAAPTTPQSWQAVPLFQAAVEAVEEAIVNALLVAGTMTGADGITAHGLDGGRVVEIMARYGRGLKAQPS